VQGNLLEQLRDLQLPAEPLWWPPAPGWWLLAVLTIAGLLVLARRISAAIGRRRPIREARTLYHKLHSDYLSGTIDDRSYLHESNELLKRLFIHGLHDHSARKANDEDWLRILDQRSNSTAFSDGPGRQLSNQRFREEPDSDPLSLYPLLSQLLKEVRP
jgi:hypothetical protein